MTYENIAYSTKLWTNVVQNETGPHDVQENMFLSLLSAVVNACQPLACYAREMGPSLCLLSTPQTMLGTYFTQASLRSETDLGRMYTMVPKYTHAQNTCFKNKDFNNKGCSAAVELPEVLSLFALS